MRIKKGDVIVSLLLLVLSIILAFLLKPKTDNKGQILRIEHNSKLLYELPLDVDTELVIDDGDHYNKIIIKNGNAYIKEANCRDQVCVHMKPISISGETIICLPNRIFLEVVSKNPTDGIDKVNR